jgi:glycerol-3-phosphate dehydrogenase (NAD(P)+)
MNLLTIGAGAMGTSLSGLFCLKNKVQLWGRRPEQIDELIKTRENTKYLPGYAIPKEVELIHEIPNWEKVDVVLSCIPTQHLRTIASSIGLNQFNGPVLNTAKGLELGSFKTPCEVLEDIGLNTHNVYSFSGPSHAEEMCKGIPTSLVLAGGDRDHPLPKDLLEAVSCKTLRPYYSRDRIGVELGGALKNIIAIACGISDGLKYGMNTTSFIITRGISEIKKYGVHRGADPSTFSGLSCIGDLVTTCCSPHSRNRSFGEAIVLKPQSPKSYGKLAEGATTVKSLIEECQHLPFDMPLSRGVFEIVWNQRSPKDVIGELLTRPIKEED